MEDLTLTQNTQETKDSNTEEPKAKQDQALDKTVRLSQIVEVVQRKEKSIIETQSGIAEIHNQLNLPQTNEIPPSVFFEQEKINKLNEEKSILESEISGSEKVKVKPENKKTDMEKAQEGWKKAAEERFGIKNFNLIAYKRDVLNDEKVAEAFNEGKDWDHIYDNKNDFFEGESYDQATKSFEAMQEIESEIPGAVRELNEKYGIRNFQRYPKEILINQLKNKNENKDLGLLIFTENDHNGAFDNQKIIWQKTYDNKKNDLNFRIIECNSIFSLVHKLLKIKEDKEKISLGILSAHSDKDYLLVGENEFINKENFSKFNDNLKEIFNDKAQLVGNACSSGAVNGWIQSLSKETRIDATGPDRPAGIEDVDFHDGKIIPKYYDNDINSNYKNGFLMSKKE